jgi:hypothetical protein
MPPRKSRGNKSSTPQQTTFIEPQPQVKNGDILDVDEAAILTLGEQTCKIPGRRFLLVSILLEAVRILVFTQERS